MISQYFFALYKQITNLTYTMSVTMSVTESVTESVTAIPTDAESALAHAIAEIKKLKQAPSPASPVPYYILENSMKFADKVLKQLVACTLNTTVDELFSECLDDTGYVGIEIDDIKFSLSLGIVPKDYMLDLGRFHGNAEVQERMVFLLNCVKLLYCPVKDHMKKQMDFNYVLQLDLNTTMFLDSGTEKRIGILLKEV